jgi:hypothetical protein
MRGAVTKGVKTTSGWKREEWESNKLLCLCILISALIHVFAIVAVGHRWLARAPELKPTPPRVVSLRLPLRPPPGRPAPVRPAVTAPPAAAAARPAEKAPSPKPVYTKEQLDQKLAGVRSEEAVREFARPKTERVEEVIGKKEMAAREWSSKEFDTVREKVKSQEEGAMGYSRIIDLRKSSDFQLGRLMELFKMEIGYGSREVTDLNIRFTNEWLFTMGQMRNYLSRRLHPERRRVLESITEGASGVALRESGEGEPRPYIVPTISAVAAILAAEDEYFAATEVKPEALDRLVFSPVWARGGPGFKVVSAEKKKPVGAVTPAAKQGGAREGSR